MGRLPRIVPTIIGAAVGAMVGNQAAVGNMAPLIVAITLCAIIAAVWGVRAMQDANSDWDA